MLFHEIGVNCTFQKNGREWRADLSRPIDVSIPLDFRGPQPNAFGVERAAAVTCELGDLIGDTRLGGSCNFEQYIFIPHCNSTHTECVGHITHERISVRDSLQEAFIPARLVTVESEPAEQTGESYSSEFGPDDTVISRRSLAAAIGGRDEASALIVRTLPNDSSKLSRSYGGPPLPPYFTTEAMTFVVESGFRHLLADLPSIDRLIDEGRLSNHRLFWGVEQGSFHTNELTRLGSTVTELIFVPDEIEDGAYVLNLQIAPFQADASPSRPLLFRIEPF